MSISKTVSISCLAFLFTLLSARIQGARQAEPRSGEGQTLHILVDKSVVINLPARLQRVLASNPAVIEIVTTSPTQVVVEGKTAGNSSLILWDESGQSQMLDVIVDIDVSGLRTAIEGAFPNAAIRAQADGGRVILSGTVPDSHVEESLVKMAMVYSRDVVDSLGRVPAHERQILLEVKIAEVDRTKLDQFGFNLIGNGAGNTLSQTSTGQFGPISGPGGGSLQLNSPGIVPATTGFGLTNLLNVFLYRPDIGLGATLEDLQSRNILQILAEPNLLALDGQKASFLEGGEFPYPVLQGGTTIGAVTIQFRPFGVKLDFTAHVGEDGAIRIHVAPEVSALDYSNALTISGFTVPALSTRRAETDIELKDGQSFGIAGLLDERVTTLLSKMPGFADLPILGHLFRSKSDSRTRTELLVLVTPHIVDPVLKGAKMPSVPQPAVPYLEKQKFDEGLPGHNKGEKPSQPSSP
jgi:pilus assembly protein CpaC